MSDSENPGSGCMKALVIGLVSLVVFVVLVFGLFVGICGLKR